MLARLAIALRSEYRAINASSDGSIYFAFVTLR